MPAVPDAAVAILDMRFATGHLYRLRQAVDLRARVCGADAREAATIVLIASELIVNVMLHARSPGQLRLSHAGQDLWLQVSDTGRGITDPAAAGIIAPPPGQPGKRGLWIVRTIADDLHIDSRPGRTTVTARIRLRRPARTSPATAQISPQPPSPSATPWMVTHHTHDDIDVAVLTINGELTLDTAPELAMVLTELTRRDHIRIVVDLTSVPFCDSVGLSSLLSAHRTCNARGGFLRLAHPSHTVLRLLSIVGLARHLTAFRTLDDALDGDESGLLAPLLPDQIIDT